MPELRVRADRIGVNAARRERPRILCARSALSVSVGGRSTRALGGSGGRPKLLIGVLINDSNDTRQTEKSFYAVDSAGHSSAGRRRHWRRLRLDQHQAKSNCRTGWLGDSCALCHLLNMVGTI